MSFTCFALIILSGQSLGHNSRPIRYGKYLSKKRSRRGFAFDPLAFQPLLKPWLIFKHSPL